MVITGYRMRSLDMKDVMMELDKVKRRLKKQIEKFYHCLLGEEIAFICDNIALGTMQKDEKISIFDNAVSNLEFKINNAKQYSAEVKYNFHVYAYVMPFEDYTYIRVTCPNKELLKAFKQLEEYSLSELECQDKKNSKTILWETLHDLYADSEPFVIDLSQKIEIDREKIVYPEKKERAQIHARHSLTNHLLNQISGGREIPPLLLMPYMDIALEMLSDKEMQVEYQKKVTHLMRIFLDLEMDSNFVFHTGKEEK